MSIGLVKQSYYDKAIYFKCLLLSRNDF